MTAPTLTTIDVSRSVDEVCQIIDRDGGVIVADMVESSTLEELWRDLGPLITSIGWGKDDFSGNRTRRLGALFARTPHAVPIALHPLFLGAATRFLQLPVRTWVGEELIETVASIQIGGTQVIQRQCCVVGGVSC